MVETLGANGDLLSLLTEDARERVTAILDGALRTPRTASYAQLPAPAAKRARATDGAAAPTRAQAPSGAASTWHGAHEVAAAAVAATAVTTTASCFIVSLLHCFFVCSGIEFKGSKVVFNFQQTKKQRTRKQASNQVSKQASKRSCTHHKEELVRTTCSTGIRMYAHAHAFDEHLQEHLPCPF